MPRTKWSMPLAGGSALEAGPLADTAAVAPRRTRRSSRHPTTAPPLNADEGFKPDGDCPTRARLGPGGSWRGLSDRARNEG